MIVTEVYTHFVMSGFDDPGSAVGDNALKYTMLECNLLTEI
jgi:hypothetical protein